MRPWPRSAGRPWVYGHRGVRRVVPENTLLAFEQSMKLGADGVELDVQIGAAGTPVVFHDETLERMTAGVDCRRISDVPVDELCSIPLQQGAAIPRLRDVLCWANHNSLYLNIELKSDRHNAEEMLAAVNGAVSEYANDLLKPRLLFSSFSTQIIQRAKRRYWPWPLAQLLNATDDCQAQSEAFKDVGIHAHYALLDEERLVQWLPTRTFLNTWTVNSPDEARRLAYAGVDGIISDEPGLIRDAIE